MKIRFYHWWVYKLYFYVWTPILLARPDMVIKLRDSMDTWLTVRDEKIKQQRKAFTIVKKDNNV